MNSSTSVAKNHRQGAAILSFSYQKWPPGVNKCQKKLLIIMEINWKWKSCKNIITRGNRYHQNYHLVPRNGRQASINSKKLLISVKIDWKLKSCKKSPSGGSISVNYQLSLVARNGHQVVNCKKSASSSWLVGKYGRQVSLQSFEIDST